MGRATSEKVGRGTCPGFVLKVSQFVPCGEPVTYRKSGGGMLTHKCDCCDSSGYAEPGGGAYLARMATIQGAPVPDQKTTDPTPEPPAAKRAAFSLAAL